MHFLRWHYRNLLCAPAEWHSKWRHSKQLHSSGAAESRTDGTARYVFVCFVFFPSRMGTENQCSKSYRRPCWQLPPAKQTFPEQGTQQEGFTGQWNDSADKAWQPEVGITEPQFNGRKRKKTTSTSRPLSLQVRCGMTPPHPNLNITSK